MSGLSFFDDTISFNIKEDENDLIVHITKIKSNDNELIDKIHNYILQLSIRQIISEKNRVEREFIIGRALYGSCLEE